MKNIKKDTVAYGYYSKVLKEPFDSIEELKNAEETYFAEQKAKQDRAAIKKADALKVEEAFRALNSARKTYKNDLNKITTVYRENLTKLKNDFEKDRNDIQAFLAKAEDLYNQALKAFTEKYPEGFHLTLKDGDFESTISQYSGNKESNVIDLFDLLFRAL